MEIYQTDEIFLKIVDFFIMSDFSNFKCLQK